MNTEADQVRAALREAASRCDGQSALAERISVVGPTPKAVVWAWIDRGRVPIEYCPAIERETGVMRWELRPSDWHRIWPELIGHADAPAVPTQEAA